MEENGEVSTSTSGLNPVAQSLMGEGRIAGFSVKLENFDGPFDLLLQLISRHKMEITEVALATVTDEFIAHIRALEETEEGWKLDQATEF
ncbi:MAG: segregation/condensation protein A, partial [Actinomycetales bacterium]